MGDSEENGSKGERCDSTSMGCCEADQHGHIQQDQAGNADRACDKREESFQTPEAGNGTQEAVLRPHTVSKVDVTQANRGPVTLWPGPQRGPLPQANHSWIEARGTHG